MDITARKEAEEERDRFFTLSLDMLAITDESGYFKRINPAFEATLGHSHAQLMARPFLHWVHPDDQEATTAVMERLRAGESVTRLENRYQCSDGSYKWLSWRVLPFEDLYYGVAHDITKVKQAEAALHKANDELELRVRERTAELAAANDSLGVEITHRRMALSALRGAMEALQTAKAEVDVARDEAESLSRQNQLILNSAGEGIFGLDDTGKVTFLNPAAAALLGWNGEDLLGRDLHSLCHHTKINGENYPLEECPIHATFTQGVTQHRDDEVLWRQNGNHFPVEYTSTPIRDGEKVLGAVVTFRDITQRREAEHALRLATEAADAANRAKSEFLSRMSHELRTPLNAILGFGQILEMRDLGPKEREGVSQILRAGRHLLELINEVLDIARIEAGHLSLSREPLDVAAALREAIDMVRPLAAAQNIQLLENGAREDTHNWHVLADRQRLHQVLINLLSNAIKYNREGGTVEVLFQIVEPTSPTAHVRIEVGDSGLGLTSAQMERLFIPFERLGAEKRAIEGTGIGLSLCKRLVEAMEGRIGARSEVERGSTFWIELPLAERTSMALQALEDDPTLPVTLQSLAAAAPAATLLHIEDNVSNLKVVERLLAEVPHLKLLTAMQGGLGVDLAQQHRPNLILLDLHLPDIEGEEVLSRLQSSPATRDIPVIVLSADATEKKIEKLLRAGARIYLTKPLDIKRLLGAIEQTLRERV